MVVLSSSLHGNPAPIFSESATGTGIEAEEAICRFYRLYSREIAGFVRKYARNDEDVSDFVQDVYCKALQYLQKSKDPVQNPRAWLYKIARFHCIDKVVKKREISQELIFQNTVNPRAASYEFEENLLNSALLDEVLNYVETDFSPEERNIFELKVIQGMNLAEVAAIMDVHASTVTRILQRLCKKITERFA